MPRGTLLLIAIPWLLGTVACGKPEAGEACSRGQLACVDEHSGLFCPAGRFVTMTCRGPSGCQKTGPDDVACDNPVAKIGDGCRRENDTACTEDRRGALVCKGGRFVVAEPCKGPRGCAIVAEALSCDHALADPGDPCAREGDPACRTDRSSLLKCKNGRFQITNGCLGPKRCAVAEKPDEDKKQLECDDSLTLPGDPCEDDGEESCSADRRSVDVCRAHKIVAGKACQGPIGCVLNEKTSRFECDATKH